jgi:hypothetical protein
MHIDFQSPNDHDRESWSHPSTRFGNRHFSACTSCEIVLNVLLQLQMKDEIEMSKQRNLVELGKLHETTRLEMEGYRGGTYLRLELHGMPCEMVQFFDPSHPILVGGLGTGEEGVGYMQVNDFDS